MNLEVTNETEVKLLSRKEISGTLSYEKSTPSKNDIAKALSEKYKVDISQILIIKISNHIGFTKSKFSAYIYDSKEMLDKITKKGKKLLEKEKKAEEEKKAKVEEAKAAAEAKKAEKEAPKEEPAAEEKPAEAKEEEKPAAEAPEKEAPVEEKKAEPASKEKPKEEKGE